MIWGYHFFWKHQYTRNFVNVSSVTLGTSRFYVQNLSALPRMAVWNSFIFTCIPSKIEWDRIPTDPVIRKLVELLDTQVFSGSVKRRSDRWRFPTNVYLLWGGLWLSAVQALETNLSTVAAKARNRLEAKTAILLMLQKSGVHQLRLVVFSHCLQGFIHVRWCRISSINSMSNKNQLLFKIEHIDWEDAPRHAPLNEESEDVWGIKTLSKDGKANPNAWGLSSLT